jgi:hypothetical protein
MPSKRAHVLLPGDLEVNRRRLLQLLNSADPIWKEEDHPELADGAEAWVRRLRDQDLELEREKLGSHWVGEGEPHK